MGTIFPISRSNDWDARIPDNNKRELPAGCEVHDEAIWPGTACGIVIVWRLL